MKGGARWSRKRHLSVGEAWDGGCSGVRSARRRGGWAGSMGSIGRDGGGGGVRAGGAGLNRQVMGVGRAGRTHRVRRAVRGRSVGWAGHVGVHLARLVGWTIGSR
jgi:hypothetical protein